MRITLDFRYVYIFLAIMIDDRLRVAVNAACMPDGKPPQLPVIISPRDTNRKRWLYPILHESVETDGMVSQKPGSRDRDCNWMPLAYGQVRVISQWNHRWRWRQEAVTLPPANTTFDSSSPSGEADAKVGKRNCFVPREADSWSKV